MNKTKYSPMTEEEYWVMIRAMAIIEEHTKCVPLPIRAYVELVYFTLDHMPKERKEAILRGEQ